MPYQSVPYCLPAPGIALHPRKVWPQTLMPARERRYGEAVATWLVLCECSAKRHRVTWGTYSRGHADLSISLLRPFPPSAVYFAPALRSLTTPCCTVRVLSSQVHSRMRLSLNARSERIPEVLRSALTLLSLVLEFSSLVSLPSASFLCFFFSYSPPSRICRRVSWVGPAHGIVPCVSARKGYAVVFS